MNEVINVESASKEYAEKEYTKSSHRTIAQLAFYEGAEWASNTTWHKAIEELPPDGMPVLGIYQHPCVGHVPVIGICVNGQFSLTGITHWCYIPYINLNEE